MPSHYRFQHRSLDATPTLWNHFTRLIKRNENFTKLSSEPPLAAYFYPSGMGRCLDKQPEWRCQIASFCQFQHRSLDATPMLWNHFTRVIKTNENFAKLVLYLIITPFDTLTDILSCLHTLKIFLQFWKSTYYILYIRIS